MSGRLLVVVLGLVGCAGEEGGGGALLGQVTASLADRAACQEGSPVCDLLGDARSAEAPAADWTRAGVTFDRVSPRSATLPGPLVGALAGRYSDGESALLHAGGGAATVTRYADEAPQDAVGACLAEGGCDIPLPAGPASTEPALVVLATVDRDDGRWWITVEPDADGGVARIGLFPDVEPRASGPTPWFRPRLGASLPCTAPGGGLIVQSGR